MLSDILPNADRCGDSLTTAISIHNENMTITTNRKLNNEIYLAVPPSADVRFHTANDENTTIDLNYTVQRQEKNNLILRIGIFLLATTTLIAAGCAIVSFAGFSSSNVSSSRRRSISYGSSNFEIFDGGKGVPSSFSNDGQSDIFQGVFVDPNHPQGYRLIVDTGDSNARLELQDEPTGEIFVIPVSVIRNDAATRLLIDFSSKGGPKDLAATVLEGGDISFSDGNVWSKTKGIPGVYSISVGGVEKIAGHLTIRLEQVAADSTSISIVVVYVEMDTDDGGGGRDIDIPAVLLDNNTILFYFSKDGAINLVRGTFRDDVIYFEDGNKLIKV